MSIPTRPLAAVALLSLLLIFASTAPATQIEYRSVEQLGADAGLVVRGEVTGVRSFWNDARSRILTEVTVEITDRYKGRAPSSVSIVQMGGELDGVRMTVAGALEWNPGEDVVLFLEDSLPGRYRVSGFSQGKYGVQRDPRTGDEYVVQANPGGLQVVGSDRAAGSARIELKKLLSRALPELQLEEGGR